MNMSDDAVDGLVRSILEVCINMEERNSMYSEITDDTLGTKTGLECLQPALGSLDGALVDRLLILY